MYVNFLRFELRSLVGKKAPFPRSPEIFLRSFPEKTQILINPCIHPKIAQHSIPHVTHEENNLGLQTILTITTFLCTLQ